MGEANPNETVSNSLPRETSALLWELRHRSLRKHPSTPSVHQIHPSKPANGHAPCSLLPPPPPLPHPIPHPTPPLYFPSAAFAWELGENGSASPQTDRSSRLLVSDRHERCFRAGAYSVSQRFLPISPHAHDLARWYRVGRETVCVYRRPISRSLCIIMYIDTTYRRVFSSWAEKPSVYIADPSVVVYVLYVHIDTTYCRVFSSWAEKPSMYIADPSVVAYVLYVHRYDILSCVQFVGRDTDRRPISRSLCIICT